ncbi:MAG: hypothetical protein HC829_08285 [Bacteroidales bacterium]|nr:hypothetical protein [Bacteroidales bacterium]
MQRLHAGSDHHLAGVEPARHHDAGGIEAQHLDIAQRHRAARRIDHPHRRLAVDAGQRRGRDLDDRHRLHLQPAGHRRTQPHRLGRALQPHLDLEGAGHRIGLLGDLAHPPGGGDRGIVGEIDGDRRLARRRAQHLGRNVEHRVAPALAGQRPLQQIVADFEQTVLEDALRRCRGDIAQVQAMLQTPRKTIYDKLAKYDLKPARFR